MDQKWWWWGGGGLFPGSYRSVLVGQIPQINSTRQHLLFAARPPRPSRSSTWVGAVLRLGSTAAFRAQSILFPPERSPANANLWPAITSSVDVALDGGNSGFSGDVYHLGNAGGGLGEGWAEKPPERNRRARRCQRSARYPRPSAGDQILRKTSRSSGDALAAASSRKSAANSKQLPSRPALSWEGQLRRLKARSVTWWKRADANFGIYI